MYVHSQFSYVHMYNLLNAHYHAQDLLVSLDLAVSAEFAVDVVSIVVVVVQGFVIVVVVVIMVGPVMTIVDVSSSSSSSNKSICIHNTN